MYVKQYLLYHSFKFLLNATKTKTYIWILAVSWALFGIISCRFRTGALSNTFMSSGKIAKDDVPIPKCCDFYKAHVTRTGNNRSLWCTRASSNYVRGNISPITFNPINVNSDLHDLTWVFNDKWLFLIGSILKIESAMCSIVDVSSTSCTIGCLVAVRRTLDSDRGWLPNCIFVWVVVSCEVYFIFV